MKFLLAGRWVSRPDVIEVLNPESGELVGAVPLASMADVELAVAHAAGPAQRIARAMPTYKRVAILRQTAQAVALLKDEFALMIATEGIKPIRQARYEVSRAIDTLNFSADEVDRLGGQSIAFDRQPHGVGRTGYSVREPIGVVVAITPFNDPLNLVAHKLGPAIGAGNTVILKPHSATPLCALMLARCFEEAGLPEGVLQVLTGPGKTIGLALATCPKVSMVTLTGSRTAGQAIAAGAGIKRLAMELGSNSPTVILNDADLDMAIPDCVSGAYWAAGQNCLHVQRLIVEAGIYDEVRERFIAKARGVRVGKKLDERTDMASLINRSAARRVIEAVEDAVRGGASLLLGGHGEGSFVEPTLLEGVELNDPLSQDELYGPVTVLQRANDLEHAIDLANGVDYGLQSAIFTRSISSSLRAVQDFRCGAVIINGTTDFRVDSMPFGGIKSSGLGREGVGSAMLEMTEPKVICWNAGMAANQSQSSSGAAP